MKQGKVCETHQEFSPDGVCRWCPTPPSEAPATYLGMTIPPLAHPVAGLLPAWPLPDPNIGPPPLPVASCKHDGALLDFSGTISCAACGKILGVQSVSVPPFVPILPALHYWDCACLKTGQAACNCGCA
jgi:hypothetical protein